MSLAVSPSVALELAERGQAVILDVRPSPEFARGHAAGAISLPFSARGLVARARIAVPAGGRVIVAATDEETAANARLQLAEGGFEAPAVISGGMAAWRAAALPERTIAEVAVTELPSLPPGDIVVDVREPIEWTTGHVPGARLIPLGELRAAVPSLDRRGRVITICEAGVRSCTAASILAAAGFADVAHVPAGSSGYRRSGLPLAFPQENEVIAR